MRSENASINVVRTAYGVSDSGQKVSLSLSACNRTDDESCAGEWGSMIDNGGEMSIMFVHGWMIILCSSLELKRQEESSSV